MSTGRITASREAITLIESSLDQELSVVRCQFWVERWRAAELCLTHGEVIDIGFSAILSTEFCILPIELFRSS